MEEQVALESTKYSPSLDGVRGLAVLAVVAFHMRESWFPGGFVGVDIFFVLSGFLITRLLIAEHHRTGTVSFSRFYVRRGLRLLPALLVVCLFVGAANLLLNVPGHAATLFGVVTALTYTSSIFAAAGGDLGNMLPTWSLSVEEYFYLVWPAILVVILRTRRPRAAVAALCVVAVLFHAIVPTIAGWNSARVYYAPDTRFEQLLMGALLAFMFPVVALKVRPWMAVGSAAVLALFVLMPARFTDMLYLHGLSTVIAALAAIFIAHVAPAGGSWLRRVLCVRPLLWVGKRSYGVYLWSGPLMALTAMIPVRGLIQLPLISALVFVAPALSFRFVEAPFLRIKNRFAGRRNVSDARLTRQTPEAEGGVPVTDG
jgi:peptidoglycan/LPS O-acetylase OafA/YrhL